MRPVCRRNRERITQLREPASQAAAGRVTDPHVLDHLGRVDSALIQIDHRLVIAVELNAIEISDYVQQRHQAAPLPQQHHGLREVHLVIEFGETNHIATTAAAVTVEQAFIRIQ
jgi:hypothetical protein